MPEELKTINPFKKFNGIFIPEGVTSYRGISPGAKLVLGRLMRYAGKKGVAFPHVETLAEEVGLGERQTREYIKELIDEKFIYRSRVFALGNTYSFLDHPCYSGHDSGSPRVTSTSFLSGGIPPLRNFSKNDSSKRRDAAAANRRDAAAQPPSPPLITLRESFEESHTRPQNSFLSKKALELLNQDTTTTEESGLEQDSPPIPATPSRPEHLDQDVEFTPIRPITTKHVLSRMKSNPGRTIKANTWARNKISEAIDKLPNTYSEEMVLAAVEAFLKESFWADYPEPALAFPKYLANYDAELPVAQSQAVGRMSGIGAEQKTPLGPDSTKLAISVYIDRWNAAMPEAYRVKHKPSLRILDKLFDAERNPEFVEGYEKIVERCRKCNQAGSYDIPDFNWLFSTPNGKDINWYRILHGELAWAEKPREVSNGRPKSPGEIAEENYQKFLEREKLNGTNGSKSITSKEADSQVVGVPVGDANDR